MTTHWDKVVDQTSIIFAVGCMILSVLYGFGVLSIRLPNFSEIKIAEFETEVPQSPVVVTDIESKPKPKLKPKPKPSIINANANGAIFVTTSIYLLI